MMKKLILGLAMCAFALSAAAQTTVKEITNASSFSLQDVSNGAIIWDKNCWNFYLYEKTQVNSGVTIQIMDRDFNNLYDNIHIPNLGTSNTSLSDYPRRLYFISNMWSEDIEGPETATVFKGLLGKDMLVFSVLEEIERKDKPTSWGGFPHQRIQYFIDSNGEKVDLGIDENFYIENYLNIESGFHFGEDHRIYLVRKYYNPFEGNNLPYSIMKIFRYDSSSSEVTPTLVSEHRSKAWPNPLGAGEVFTIELGSVLDAPATVTVASMNGARAYTATVDPGTSAVRIPANALRNGTYVYIVNQGNVQLDKGKIIAK